jgi:hypothetical protein
MTIPPTHYTPGKTQLKQHRRQMLYLRWRLGTWRSSSSDLWEFRAMSKISINIGDSVSL